MLVMKITEYVTYILTGFILTMIMSLVSVYLFPRNVNVITTKDIVYYAQQFAGYMSHF